MGNTEANAAECGQTSQMESVRRAGVVAAEEAAVWRERHAAAQVSTWRPLTRPEPRHSVFRTRVADSDFRY